MCIKESIKYSNKNLLNGALNGSRYHLKSVLKKALNTVSLTFAHVHFVSPSDSIANLAVIFHGFHVVPAPQTSRSEEWVWIVPRSIRYG